MFFVLFFSGGGGALNTHSTNSCYFEFRRIATSFLLFCPVNKHNMYIILVLSSPKVSFISHPHLPTKKKAKNSNKQHLLGLAHFRVGIPDKVDELAGLRQVGG